MPAAINLLKVTVSGWKAIDENPVEISFEGDSWLIYGGNETGKSSTFSAIRAALFERPDARGTFANDWVNNQTPNGARIELELLVDGRAYTIVKTRGTNGNGNTKLYEGCGGGRTQISTGTDAVNEILELIGARPRGGAGGRDLEQPQNWGILAWLLAPQGMDSVTPAREQGTQTIGLERAVSDQMVQVEETLKASLNTQLTPTGRVAGHSTYKAAIDAMGDATETLSEIETRRGKYTHLLQEITQVEQLIEGENGKLVEAEEAINNLVDEEVDLTDINAEIATIQGQIDTKEQEIVAAEQNVTALKEIENEANTHQNKLKGFKEQIKKVHSRKKALDSEIKSNHEQIKSHAERLKENSEENLTKQGLLRVAAAETTRIELKKTLVKLDELENERSELLKQGPILADDELRNMHDLVSRYDKADAMLEAISKGMGVSVQIDGDLKANWNIDGLETEVDSEIAFAQEMAIQSDHFTLNLKKETNEDKNWVEERNDCATEFEKYSVADSAGLRKKWEAERLRAKLAESLNAKIDPISSREEIEGRLKKLPEQSDGSEKLDEEVLEGEIKALGSEKKDLETIIQELNDNTEPLETESTTLGNELGALRASETATDALATSAYARRDTEIEAKGVMATRVQRLNHLNGEQVDMKDARQQLIVRKETEELAARGGLKQARRVKSHIERELISKQADLNTLNSNAEELGGENLQQALVKANIAVKATCQNKKRIEGVVEAEKRLLNRFTDALDVATELEIGPIKDQVQIWLAAVTQGKWTQLEMDSKLNVTRIDGPASLPIEGEKVGSGGLKQVIHGLIRLAVACKIHDDKAADNPEFPPVALVMDESQGHVDDDRVRRLVGRFNAEIGRGRVQVIALSHRRNEFQALNARNYNVERREATDDRDIED
jgi:DNA repair exonuclease SbcCD ATPase subunit